DLITVKGSVDRPGSRGCRRIKIPLCDNETIETRAYGVKVPDAEGVPHRVGQPQLFQQEGRGLRLEIQQRQHFSLGSYAQGTRWIIREIYIRGWWHGVEQRDGRLDCNYPVRAKIVHERALKAVSYHRYIPAITLGEIHRPTNVVGETVRLLQIH